MTPYQALMADAALMTKDQLKTFTEGVEYIVKYQAGRFMGLAGTPKLLVSAASSMDLMLNAMAYLSKFCPPADTKFQVLYRIHDFSKIGKPVKPGANVKIKPFRSFLSWSADPKISVAGVDDHEVEGLLGINGTQAKVVFSYKIVKRLAPQGNAPDSLARLYGALYRLHKSLDDWTAEQEVIVYHSKPFIAKILRVVDSVQVIEDIVKSFGLKKYVGKSTKVRKGLQFLVNAQDVELVFKILKTNLGSPSMRTSNAKYKKWLGATHLFKLSPGTCELTITALKR